MTASVASREEEHPLTGLLYDQTDLEKLCAERPLDWDEYAHMNEFHGNACMLKEYAGLPMEEPLPLAIEHAIPFDLTEPYPYDLNCGLPMFLGVHDRSASLYRAAGMPVVHVVGSMYLYAIELFKRRHPDAGEVKRRGTLVFPDKSTLLMDTDFDRESFARRLKALPEVYQPVVVCTYWRDFVRGGHLPFLEAGLPVVSCGHVRDGDFMIRLYDLCRRFRYSCANDLAGSFVYSILSGCHFFHLPGGNLTQSKGGVATTYERDPTLEKGDKAECLSAAPFPPQDPALQRSLVAQHAGVSHLKSPEEVRGYYEEAVNVLRGELRPGEIRFGLDTNVGDLHRLRPIGVDRDGWVGKRGVLRVANTQVVGGLRLHLELANPGPEARVRTDVSVNGSLAGTLVSPPFAFTVGFPLPQEGGEVVVEFTSNHDIALLDDPRRRSIRFITIELLEPGALTEAKFPGAPLPSAAPTPKTKRPAGEAKPKASMPRRSFWGRLAKRLRLGSSRSKA